jgi:O-antigen/teichoic acid export membrane protein
MSGFFVIPPALHKIKDRLGPLGWGGILVFGSSRLGDLVNLLYKFILGRRLSADEFGAFDPIFSFLAILAIPVTILYQTGMKSLSRLEALGEPAKIRSLIGLLGRLAGIGSLLSLALVFVFRDFLLSRLHLEAGWILGLIAGLSFLAWWEPLYGTILQGVRHYRLLIVNALLNPAILIGVGSALVIGWGLGLRGALLARIAASLLAGGIVFYSLRHFWVGERRALGNDEWIVMRNLLLPMALFTISSTLLFHFDRLLVRNFLTAESGGYAVIVTLGSIPGYLVGSVVFVLFPLAAAEHARGQAVRILHRQALLAGGVIGLGAVAGLALFSPLIVRHWNPLYLPYAGYVWLYAASIGLLGLIQITATIEMARNRFSFLIPLAPLTLLMCLVLYLGRFRWTLAEILGILILTRVLILAGMAAFALYFRASPAKTPAA